MLVLWWHFVLAHYRPSRRSVAHLEHCALDLSIGHVLSLLLSLKLLLILELLLLLLLLGRQLTTGQMLMTVGHGGGIVHKHLLYVQIEILDMPLLLGLELGQFGGSHGVGIIAKHVDRL